MPIYVRGVVKNKISARLDLKPGTFCLFDHNGDVFEFIFLENSGHVVFPWRIYNIRENKIEEANSMVVDNRYVKILTV